jgi:WD40 repeat protein
VLAVVRNPRIDAGFVRQLVRTLEGHSSGVRGLNVSGDGRYIYSSSADGVIKEWQIDDGQVARSASPSRARARLTSRPAQLVDTFDRRGNERMLQSSTLNLRDVSMTTARDGSLVLRRLRESLLCVWRTAPLRLSCRGTVTRGLRCDATTKRLLQQQGAVSLDDHQGQ